VAAEPDRDAGAAPVDFVLVGSLLTLLFLAILQVGVDFYVRNLLAACAADGARYAANADVADPAAAAARTGELIHGALGGHLTATQATAHAVAVDGQPAVEVDVTARLPLLAWFLPAGPTVHVTGHALVEPAR
jgi:Flp pilus assembly protein TadG